MMMKHVPNILTFIRIALLAPIIIGLLNEQYTFALLFFVIASITDGLDGFLARRYSWTSRLGSIIDPLADKALLLSCFIALFWLGVIPSWLIFIVIARDIIILSGGVAFHMMIGTYEFSPSQISKLNTFLQIVLVFSLIVNLSYSVIPLFLLDYFMYIVAFVTLASCIDYVWVWGGKAVQHWTQG